MNGIDRVFQYLTNHNMIVFVVMIIVFDVFIGILKATKDKKINSAIGIDGIIRKTAMVGCLSFLIIIDILMKIDMIGWLPSQMLDVFKIMGISKIGISDVFGLLFIIFELISIIKNWTLLGLPIFKGLNAWVINFLETFTDELPTTNRNK